MNQATAVPQKTLEVILNRLDQLTKEIINIKEKLDDLEPTYGSNAWWVWSEKKADEEIASGKVIKFNSVKTAVKWLNP